MARRSERSDYRLVGTGSYVDGDWTGYAIRSEAGKVDVGYVSKRSGGGWIATLPVFDTEDNGIADVRVKVGVAYGRGQTPAEALEEADRRAIQGITGRQDYAQKEMI